MKKNLAKPSTVPRLSEAEWIVMKPFWERDALAARDLYAALPPGHGWSYKTVKTMLARLVKKGALEYTQVGNSYLYRARFSRETMLSPAVKSFAARVLDGALRPFLVNFLEGRRLSPEDISVLREIVDDQEQNKSAVKSDKVRTKND